MGETQPQAQTRDATTHGRTVAPFRFDRAQLLPPAVVAPLRTMARDFLALSHLEKLVLHAIANRSTATEAGDWIAATVAEIEETLAKPDAEREADIAAVAADAEKRLAPYASIFAQIDPARRATVAVHFDGRADLTPADAATARATPCVILPMRVNPKRKVAATPEKIGIDQLVTKRNKRDGRISRRIGGCHSCGRGKGQWCWACQRVSKDDIRISHSPHNINQDLTTRPAPENPGADAPSATNLAPEIEDRLRLFVATFISTNQLGILYLAHKATRTPSTFAEYLRQFVENMASYCIDKQSAIGHRFCRATMYYAWKRIVSSNPSWAVFKTYNASVHNTNGRKGNGRKHTRMSEAEKAARAEAAREAKVAADRTFDRSEPFAADRDDDTTRHFFDDGSGTDW